MKLDDFLAKSSPIQSVAVHGYISGTVAQVLFREYLSPGLRKMLVCICGTEEEQLYRELGVLVSEHDIGKIDRSFQYSIMSKEHFLQTFGPEKMTDSSNLSPVRHEKTGSKILKRIYPKDRDLRETVRMLEAVTALHHQGKEGSPSLKSDADVEQMQKEFDQRMADYFYKGNGRRIPCIPKENLGKVGAVFLGITILSDWIASGAAFADAEDWFRLETSSEIIQQKARDFLEASGLKPTLLCWGATFGEIWPNIAVPRGLQDEVAAYFLHSLERTQAVLLEAPMGEGKTEAGIYAATQMAKQWGKDGIYIALPTAATSNQMVGRMQRFLEEHNLTDRVRLLHGTAWMLTDPVEVSNEEVQQEILNWLAPTRRGLLGQFAVGTVDQAMLAATKTKYGMLRLLGLANKVLVIDEIHSYDVYMGRILRNLLIWCRALEIPVVMLSATLPPDKKKKLLEPYLSCDMDDGYPLITAVTESGKLEERHIHSTSRSQTVQIRMESCLNDAEKTAQLAAERVKDGGCVCVLVNTVKQAQNVFLALEHCYSGDKLLFHAQFPVERRDEIEQQCIRLYGKDKSFRPAQSILVATQVVEQSLDVDFDCMITEIAPIDLLIQRMGRIFRHSDTKRPIHITQAEQIILVPEGRDYGSSGFVYPVPLLEQAWYVLRQYAQVRIPEDLAHLVAEGYDENAVPETAQEAWLEYQIEEQVNAGLSQKYLLYTPDKSLRSILDIGLFDDDMENGQGNFLSVQTRLGEPTQRIALLEPDMMERLTPYLIENGRKAAVYDRKLARDIMRKSVSVSAKRLSCIMSNLLDIYGDKLLKGLRIFPAHDGVFDDMCGNQIRNDPILGIQIKEGNV